MELWFELAHHQKFPGDGNDGRMVIQELMREAKTRVPTAVTMPTPTSVIAVAEGAPSDSPGTYMVIPLQDGIDMLGAIHTAQRYLMALETFLQATISSPPTTTWLQARPSSSPGRPDPARRSRSRSRGPGTSGP